MSDLKRFFHRQRDTQLHPKVRYWRQVISEGRATRTVCDFWRKREGLSFAPAKLYVFFYDQNGKVIEKDQDDWDPELNSELMRLGVRAVSIENEGERLGMMMRTWFSMPETEYGDGFFNTVLDGYLRASGFADRSPSKEVLQMISESRSVTDNRHRARCIDDIEAIIVEAARSLVDDLKYQELEAEDILAAAIAYYLDERFSITNRRMLGFR